MINKGYFFCGIGGSGMSPLASFLYQGGAVVSGSDRNINSLSVQKLKEEGIDIYPQDGSGVVDFVSRLDKDSCCFVASAAVEDTVQDVIEAKELGLKILKRPELLAQVLSDFKYSIAVGGTSGKSTTSAMLVHILEKVGKKPNAIIGAKMKNFEESFIGQESELMVIEADESDGSIELYSPFISVLTNVSLDHKPLEELRPLFKRFIKRASFGAVINVDDVESLNFLTTNSNAVTFSLKGNKSTFNVQNIQETENGSCFVINGIMFNLNVIGEHNIANAAAAVAAAFLYGVSLVDSANALADFKGVKRRLDLVGVTDDNIKVIDDFAHNPAKIEASLNALTSSLENVKDRRLLVVYQPHGFVPTRLMKDDLINCFSKNLRKQDKLWVMPIFYAGGTVSKDISSTDIGKPLIEEGLDVKLPLARKEVVEEIANIAGAGDVVIVMGARDDSLSLFAQDIFERLRKENSVE